MRKFVLQNYLSKISSLNENDYNGDDDLDFPKLDYKIKTQKLPEDLQKKIVQLTLDKGTQDFLDDSIKKPAWLASFLSSMLQNCFRYGFTDANGLTDRGKMHVFSKEQYAELIGLSEMTIYNNPNFDLNLLDVGAGDGTVVQKYEKYFTSITCTEISKVMCKKLKQKGYNVIHNGDLGCDELIQYKNYFDVINCLNLLDRCDKPLTMLKHMLRLLKPGGLILVALVLPFEPFVEKGQKQLEPTESIKALNAYQSFEEGINTFVTQVAEPLGFNVIKISKVPYISQGDNYQPFYVLDDAVFVLQKPQNMQFK